MSLMVAYVVNQAFPVLKVECKDFFSDLSLDLKLLLRLCSLY